MYKPYFKKSPLIPKDDIMVHAHTRLVFTKLIVSHQKTLKGQKGSSDFFGQSACSVFCLSFALIIPCW